MHKITYIYNLYFLRFVKLLSLTVLGLSIIGISAAIISMLFGVPIGDDYGAIATFRLNSNWPHEAMHSLAETGRYGQSVVASVLYGIFGDKIVTLLPLIFILWFIFLSYLFVKKFLQQYVKNQQLLALYSIATAIILVFLVLFVNNAPKTTNLIVWVSYQSFFWPSGIITYTLPLLTLLSGFYALFLSRFRTQITRRAQTIYFIILILLTSLFNEVQPVTISVIAAGLLILSYLKFYSQLRKYRPTLLITIGMSALGLVALFFAPGRTQRSKALETITPTSDGSVVDSIGRNLTVLTHELYLRPREVVLLVVIGLLAAVAIYQIAKNKKVYDTHIKQMLPYAILLVVICIISIIVSTALIAVGYGYSAGVYVRTMLICQLTYVISLPFLTFSLASLALSKFGMNNVFRLLIVLISVVFIISIPKYIDKTLTQVNSSVTYHNAWIEQDSLLQKAASNGMRETVYLKNPVAGIGDGFSLQCVGPYALSTMWLNVQITQYYGNNDRVCPEIDKEADQVANRKWVQ
ncbi:hypothetical protein D3C73_102390 [compost metagenome]